MSYSKPSTPFYFSDDFVNDVLNLLSTYPPKNRNPLKSRTRLLHFDLRMMWV